MSAALFQRRPKKAQQNIRMASPEAVKATTGYEIGSIPPFHWQPDGFRSFMDESLIGEPVLGVGAGLWGEEILIAPEHLVQASRAQVVNLTDKNRPALPEVGWPRTADHG